MSNQEIFEFLKNNLKIRASVDRQTTWGGNDYYKFWVKLILTNPETGKDEVISEEVFET